jgi:hypothetical protein
MPRGAASSMTSIARPTGTSRVVALTAAMRRMVDGRQVRCKLDGLRTYDRCAGVCYSTGRTSRPNWCARRSPGTARATAAGLRCGGASGGRRWSGGSATGTGFRAIAGDRCSSPPMGPHHDVRYRVGTDLRSCHSNCNERQDPGEPEVDRSWVDVHAMTVSNLRSKHSSGPVLNQGWRLVPAERAAESEGTGRQH